MLINGYPITWDIETLDGGRLKYLLKRLFKHG